MSHFHNVHFQQQPVKYNYTGMLNREDFHSHPFKVCCLISLLENSLKQAIKDHLSPTDNNRFELDSIRLKYRYFCTRNTKAN